MPQSTTIRLRPASTNEHEPVTSPAAPRSVMAGRAKDTKGKVYRVQFCQVHAFVKRNFCHHGSCADHESQSNHPA